MSGQQSQTEEPEEETIISSLQYLQLQPPLQW